MHNLLCSTNKFPSDKKKIIETKFYRWMVSRVKLTLCTNVHLTLDSIALLRMLRLIACSNAAAACMYDGMLEACWRHVRGMLEILHRDELRVGGGDTIGVQLVLMRPGIVI